MDSRFLPGRRTRWVASWLPAVLLVPAGLVTSVVLTQPEDPDAAMSRVQPLEPGTTWIYDVRDHGKPSGTRVRQVLGQAQLFSGGRLIEMMRISSNYDQYPGQGRYETDAYVAVEDKQLLQYGLISRGQMLDVEPPAPAYVLPAERGTSWKYDGLVGENPLKFTVEVTDTGEVEAGGHTFEDCTQWTSVIEIADTTPAEVEVIEEWTCPDVGVVLSTDTYEAGDVSITEELKAFHSPDHSFIAEGFESPSSAEREGVAVSAAGFNPQRTHAVPDGSLGRRLAWTQSGDIAAGLAAVSDAETTVLGEQDGSVSARSVKTGELRWQIMLEAPIVATPAIAGDLVLVADAAKNLWALSLVDGSARWVHHFGDIVSVAPAVGEDSIAVAVEDGTVTVLQRDTGAEIWSAQLGGQARTPPALEGDHLVVADNAGTMTAFAMSDGTETWSNELSNGLDFGPTLAGSSVLAVDGDGVLSSFDVDDGALQWQARGRAFPSEALAVGNGVVVTVGGGTRAEGFALDDGERLWSRPIPESDVAAAVVGDEVVVVSETGRLTVLALEDGTRVDGWDLPRPAPDAELEVDTPLSVVGDALVITADVSAVNFSSTGYAYPLSDEAGTRGGVFFEARHRVFPTPVAARPVLDGDVVYAADIDGTVQRSDGRGPATPVLTENGTIYGIAAQDDVVVIPREDEVWAVPGKGGKPLWKLPATEGFVGSVPTIVADTVFVPLYGAGLTAVDLRSGQPRWLTPLAGSSGTSSAVPLPNGDVVYAANGLARFDGQSGEEVWRLGGDFIASVAYSSPSHHGGTVSAVLVSPDATKANFERYDVVAVDAANGRELWRRELSGAVVEMGPVAGDGVVVVNDGGGLVTGLDAKTGEPMWDFQMASSAAGLPVIRDGVVHLIERGRVEDLLARDYRVIALDTRSGEFLGSFEPPGGNDVPLGTVGSTPEGQLLVPTVDAIGQTVAILESNRD